MNITHSTIETPRKKWVWGFVGIIIASTLIIVPLTACVEFLNNLFVVKPNPPIPFWPNLLIKNLGSSVIAIIVGILIGTVRVLNDTSNDFHNILNDFRTEKNTLKEEVATEIKNTFPTILSKHKINITGVHRGKPAGAALIAKAELFSGKSKDYLDGLLIMEHHASPTNYASHCNKVIEHNGIGSIYSMSDFGLDLTFHMFCETNYKANKRIIDWIKTVNKAKKSDIKRIQVLTKERYKFIKKLIAYKQDDTQWKDLIHYVRPSLKNQYENGTPLEKDEEKAKELADNLVNGYKWYCNNYAFVDLEKALDNGEIEKINTHDHVKWAVYTRESLRWTEIDINKITPGEFIVFNGDVLVRYSEDSRLSETLTGPIVDPFKTAFTVAKCWEKQIELRPLFFGKGNYDKSAEKGEYVL